MLSHDVDRIFVPDVKGHLMGVGFLGKTDKAGSFPDEVRKAWKSVAHQIDAVIFNQKDGWLNFGSIDVCNVRRTVFSDAKNTVSVIRWVEGVSHSSKEPLRRDGMLINWIKVFRPKGQRFQSVSWVREEERWRNETGKRCLLGVQTFSDLHGSNKFENFTGRRIRQGPNDILDVEQGILILCEKAIRKSVTKYFLDKVAIGHLGKILNHRRTSLKIKTIETIPYCEKKRQKFMI
jgi:hypothetical protein